ncbi:hypothetical protein KP79_PYT04142 [Mizuhopecten yessoensis]|uniref:Uncharacterized protein n=1 Tax=Mizuhopecten yessoensis TaxID=6573 RepID=A0A210QCV2_MIZYE|nr:hypothetical protein KP79_PYT04142 [Mizuhopecten yessoensis]
MNATIHLVLTWRNRSVNSASVAGARRLGTVESTVSRRIGLPINGFVANGYDHHSVSDLQTDKVKVTEFLSCQYDCLNVEEDMGCECNQNIKDCRYHHITDFCWPVQTTV